MFRPRKLLYLSVLLALTLAILAGCGAPQEQAPAAAEEAAPAAQEAQAVPESKYKEAPMLAERVAAGELPPVDERLPLNPMVVEPVEQIGEYGGTWLWFGDGQRRIQNPSEFTDVGLLMWNMQQNASIPGMAEGWEVSDDGMEFTIKLREGLKWSDGQPFTADDIVFWFEDIIMNDELMPVKEVYLRTANGSVGTLEKIDDYTVKFKFEQPHGMFITLLTKEIWTFAPKHYLSQFHVAYTDETALEQAMEEAGVETWVDLFWLKADFGSNGSLGMANPDLPTTFPWLQTTEPPSERYIFVRNPYFFAVDTEGNQLPYIDQVDFRIVDPEVLNLKITAGEPNFQASRAQAFKDISLYTQYAEENEYRIIQWGDLQISEAAIWINQNTPDPVDREIYQDVRFRRALSIGINRQRINETLYLGLGRPTQATIGSSKYFRDEYFDAYTQYDVEEANRLLDEMGLTEYDSEGFRLKPDGARLAPVIEVPNARLGMIDNLTMIKEDWKDIGVDLTVKPIDQTLWNNRMRSGQMQFTGWPMGKPETETDLTPISTDSDWAPLWGLWYNTNGAEGEEPPDYIKELQNYWTQILLATDDAVRDEYMHKILQAQADNVWVIGVVGPVPKPIIAKTWFRNVNENCTWSFHHGHFLGCTAPYQFYIEKDHQ